MNGMFFGPSGAVQSAGIVIDICMIRWGGGADHGKTHVFTLGPSQIRASQQCVVDDFGNLVGV